MVLEIAIESPVVHRAQRAGYFVRKVVWFGRKDAPDRIFARKDRGVVFIEFKAPGKAPRLSQTIEHRLMRAAGIEVHVCDNIDAAMRILWLRPGANGAPPLDEDDLI